MEMKFGSRIDRCLWQGIEIKFVEPPEARMPTKKARGGRGLVG
jgi:hypothetical protein